MNLYFQEYAIIIDQRVYNIEIESTIFFVVEFSGREQSESIKN